MAKDYTPYDAPLAPPAARKAAYYDVREQFIISEASRLSTLSTMLHRAEAKIAILEYTVKVYETHPLLVAVQALEATGASVTFVGEIRSGDTGRIQASGGLLTVLETLAARHAMHKSQTLWLDEQVIEVGKKDERKTA